MKKMSAKINNRKVSLFGNVQHFKLADSSEEYFEIIVNPVSLDIMEEDGGFLLLRMDEKGNCIADTWHISLEDAKSQAMFEFSVGELEWKRHE